MLPPLLLLLLLLVLVGLVGAAAGAARQRTLTQNSINKQQPALAGKHSFTQPKHAPGVVVADFAEDVPKLRIGERCNDLTSGVHWDNLMQDTPPELRPASLILFHGFRSCPTADADLKFRSMAEHKLPSRERLHIATYDMDANPVRAWFKFTPEMDLAKRFGVKTSECPSLVYVPRTTDCDGWTQWCTKKTDDPLVLKAGCEDFVDPCGKHAVKWDGKGAWLDWVNGLMAKEALPEISPIFGSYLDQNRWLRDRDETTNDNELRNYHLVEGFPAFTKLGFVAMPTPPTVQQFFVDFWNRRKRNRKTEHWHSGSTQMGFHDVQTTFVSLDEEGWVRDKLANEVLKPIVEKWSGMSPLELTSFYGIREYKKDSWLRGHIDRIDTHVLSITFVVAKTNASDINQILSLEDVEKLPKWPLEVYAYDGDIYRHEHVPNTMILYESSKLIHGRPYKNLGPDHLGAFCHFKPTNMDALQAAAWEKIASFARSNQARNTHRGVYRTSPIVEPSKPVFSTKRYGAATGFESSANPKSSRKKANEGYLVQMINESDQALDLAWINTNSNDEFVFQGTVSSKGQVQIETHLGHKFVWLEHGTQNPVPAGKFEVEAGSRVYKYQSKLAVK